LRTHRLKVIPSRWSSLPARLAPTDLQEKLIMLKRVVTIAMAVVAVTGFVTSASGEVKTETLRLIDTCRPDRRNPRRRQRKSYRRPGGSADPEGRARVPATPRQPGGYRARMKAAVQTRYSPPNVVRVLDVPCPAKDNEVLIKVHGEGLTAGRRASTCPANSLPRILTVAAPVGRR
jgi:hypothetical protein